MATETGDNQNDRKGKEFWKYFPALLLSISFIGFGLYINYKQFSSNRDELSDIATDGERWRTVYICWTDLPSSDLLQYFAIQSHETVYRRKGRHKKKKEVTAQTHKMYASFL